MFCGARGPCWSSPNLDPANASPHLLRDANATQDHDAHIQELSDGETALIVDYMMKYEGSKFAEIQLECFAKTKLSVLGGMFMRRILQGDITASPDDLGPEHEFKITHCWVVSDDCNQDWYKFVCDLFAQLKEYKRNNPHVRQMGLPIWLVWGWSCC